MSSRTYSRPRPRAQSDLNLCIQGRGKLQLRCLAIIQGYDECVRFAFRRQHFPPRMVVTRDDDEPATLGVPPVTAA